MLEQRTVRGANITLHAGVEDDPHVGHALLLELVDEERFGMAGRHTPVDPARRVARLILAHPEELHTWAALTRGNRTRVDPCSPWPDGQALQLHDLRHDDQ